MQPRHRSLRFVHSEDGGILVFWAMSLAVMLGIVALSFDTGRIAATQSELQSYADTVVLAAAGELDGNDDAIDRARLAALLITDSQVFGSGSQALGDDADFTLDFYSTLPASDGANLAAGLTTDARAAAFARIVVTPKTVGFTFAAAFRALTGGAASNNSVGAVAVAGFTQYACDITPLMFCIPGDAASFDADQEKGRMIRLRSGGQGAAWGPGDFGFLDPDKVAVDGGGPCAGLNGVQLDACLIGAEGSITQCFAQRGVDTEPGQKVGIENAIFNVRFDMYRSIMNGKRNNPDYAPAPNVIKGIVPRGGGACIGTNADLSPDSLGLPRDTCFGTGTCARYGDGDWSAGRTAYVAMNYDGTDPHGAAETRYEYYQAEIERADSIAPGADILESRAETGRPSCSRNRSQFPERRVVVAAAIDCTANPVQGRTTGVPVKEFVKMFLTEPVGTDASSPPRVDLWVEIIGSAKGNGGGEGGTGGVFHDVVQLYR